MTLPRMAWYWHVLIAVVLFVVMTAITIWLDAGPALHSLSDTPA